MVRRLALAIVVVFCCVHLSGCIIIPLGSFTPELREVTVRPGGWRAGKILLIDVDGVITARGGDGLFGTGNMVANIDEHLKRAEADRSIKAVIVRINSPGGGVTASDILYRRLAEFRRKTKIPVYACMTGMGASGGYYVAMAADRVYASPTTVTGSIGVIAVFPEGESLLDKIGVRFSVVKSGDYKDIGSLFRHMEPEEREILQGVVGSMYDRFIEVVHAGRPSLSPERIREAADGRVLTARQAHAAGLIDGVFYIDEVVELLESVIGERKARVVAYRRWRAGATSLYAQQADGDAYAARGGGWLDSLRRPAPPPTQVNLINVGTSPVLDPESYFHYMWIP